MSDLAVVFRKPFAEQVAAFRLRLGELAPTARWDDLRGAEHDRAFMVAGAVKADLLADLAQAVDKAIAEGTTLEDFRRDFRSIVERRGWHGWTGEGTPKGEAWRTRVIYKTNMATSYAAGRMAQLVEGKFAYWVYRHGNALEPRLHHLAWDGLALRPDHDFWKTHSPPNGWGCTCYVAGARTPAGVRRLGGDPGKPLPDGWQARSPKTGAPVGIDKGWDHAPGAGATDQIRVMASKSVAWPYELAKAFMADVPEAVRDDLARAYRELPSTAEAAARFAGSVPTTGGVEGTPTPLRTLGLLTRGQTAEVRAATGVDADGFDFALAPAGVRHAFNRHGDARIEATRGQRALTAADFARLPEILNAPDVVAYEGPAVDGTPTMRYEKTIGEERFTALFNILTGRRRLALATMWVAIAG